MTTWARVHSPVGLNVVGVLPVVMPCSAAQRIALKNGLPLDTSVNGLFRLLGSGLPSKRQRNVTTCPRVHVSFGLNVPAEVPVVMPCSAAQRIA